MEVFNQKTGLSQNWGQEPFLIQTLLQEFQAIFGLSYLPSMQAIMPKIGFPVKYSTAKGY